jgi:hypothetical protein
VSGSNLIATLLAQAIEPSKSLRAGSSDLTRS